MSERLSSTLLLRERVAPRMVSTGVTALDALTGGLPRGALTEIVGPASSGRTGVMLAALAEATRRQEICALVDASDSFDPASAAEAGVDLERLLWVRCSDGLRRKFGLTRTALRSPANGFAFGGALEQVLKVTDLLLQSGGFGMVVLDLGDIPPESARRMPLTSWFRFRRAVEPTTTVLLLLEQEPCAKTCASLVVLLEREAVQATATSALRIHPGQVLAVSSAAAGGIEEPEKCTRDAAAIFRHGGGQIVAGGDAGIPKNDFVSHAALLRGTRLRAKVVRYTIPLAGVGPSGELDSSTQIRTLRPAKAGSGQASPAQIGDGSLTQHKPVQPASVNFELRAAW